MVLLRIQTLNSLEGPFPLSGLGTRWVTQELESVSEETKVWFSAGAAAFMTPAEGAEAGDGDRTSSLILIVYQPS